MRYDRIKEKAENWISATLIDQKRNSFAKDSEILLTEEEEMVLGRYLIRVLPNLFLHLHMINDQNWAVCEGKLLEIGRCLHGVW